VARCAKLIETYPKRLAAVIAGKGGSTKYWFWGGVNSYACSSFQIFCLISCLFHTLKENCIFKVVGMLCKSNDTNPQKKRFYFQVVRQQNRKKMPRGWVLSLCVSKHCAITNHFFILSKHIVNSWRHNIGIALH
jgi:hypothetical protein